MKAVVIASLVTLVTSFCLAEDHANSSSRAADATKRNEKYLELCTGKGLAATGASAKADGFLDRLNKLRKSQGDPCTYRLPTEAEWEFAARAGTETKYSFGNNENQLDNFAWFTKNSGNQTHDVDDSSKQGNPKGIQGMHGNVWEWCQDTYQANLGTSLQTDPKIGVDNDDGSGRVVRGGGWGSGARFLRSALGGRVSSGFRSNDLGLRLVRQCQ